MSSSAFAVDDTLDLSMLPQPQQRNEEPVSFGLQFGNRPVISLGLDPGHLNAGAANDVAWWCAAESEIETCNATDETGFGTPGAENDPC